MNNQTKDKVHTDTFPEDIINIGKSCINFGVTGEIPKNNIGLTRLIRKVNDSLRERCVLNEFGFISNYISKNLIQGT